MSAAAPATVNQQSGEEYVGHLGPLATKIAAVVASVQGRIKKDGLNEHFNYRFTSEAGMLEAVRDEEARQKIAIVPSVLPESISVQPVGTKGEMLTTLVVGFTVIDGDSGAQIYATYPGAGTDRADKGVFKAVTGATKYFTQKLYRLPCGDDPEATTSEKEPRGREIGQAPARTGSTPQAARPLPATPAPAAAAPVAGPRPLVAAPAAQAPAQARPAAQATTGPRPLTAPPQAASAPLQAVVGQAMGQVAKAMEGIAADPLSVGLVDVHERTSGSHAVHGVYTLWSVLTDAGQKLAAMDDGKGQIGTGLKAAHAAGQRVVLTVEQTAVGPKITGFRISGAPATTEPLTAAEVKW